VYDELVSEEVVVDPVFGRTTAAAAQRTAIKAGRAVEVVHGQGEMKRG
jgi:hypothetical protein